MAIEGINPFLNSNSNRIQAAPAVKRQVGGNNVQFGTLTTPVTSFRETTANNPMFADKTDGLNDIPEGKVVVNLSAQAGKPAGISTVNWIY